MGERAKALGTPGSLLRIVRDLAELAEHPTTIVDQSRAGSGSTTGALAAVPV